MYGAGDEARTRYLHLGKVALYRMSYTRICRIYYTHKSCICQAFFKNFFKKSESVPSPLVFGDLWRPVLLRGDPIFTEWIAVPMLGKLAVIGGRTGSCRTSLQGWEGLTWH